LLALNLLLVGWLLIRVMRDQRDLSDIKSSLKQIVQSVPPTNSPEVTLTQVHTPDVAQLTQRVAANHGPQAKSASNIVAFIAARQAGSSLEEAAQQYDLTEDEAFAISVSYRDATPSPANNDAMS
jgi:low affinity Fe/Cu permease